MWSKLNIIEGFYFPPLPPFLSHLSSSSRISSFLSLCPSRFSHSLSLLPCVYYSFSFDLTVQYVTISFLNLHFSSFLLVLFSSFPHCVSFTSPLLYFYLCSFPFSTAPSFLPLILPSLTSPMDGSHTWQASRGRRSEPQQNNKLNVATGRRMPPASTAVTCHNFHN